MGMKRPGSARTAIRGARNAAPGAPPDRRSNGRAPLAGSSGPEYEAVRPGPPPDRPGPRAPLPHRARSPAARRDPRRTSTLAVVSAAEREGSGVRVHYLAERGARREISEHLQLGPRGTLAAVSGVGRVLRILRAARRRPPEDPYSLADDPARVTELLEHCRGARIRLELRKRLERQLTVWTEGGVRRISRVVDLREASDGIAVRVMGSQSPLWVPRAGLIRYAMRSEERLEVLAIEAP